MVVTIIALIETTSAAATTNEVKLSRIVCTYPTVVASCPIANAPKLPAASKAIMATRNSVVFFLSMFKSPTIKPKTNRVSRIVDVETAVINAARTATTRPTRNAHFPIKSNSILYLFLVVNLRRKLFK